MRYQSANPVANVLVVIAGALIIGVSLVLGFFAFLALGAIVLVTAAVIGIRVWWFNRKLAKAGGGHSASGRDRPAGVIEGEYTVVQKDRDEP